MTEKLTPEERMQGLNDRSRWLVDPPQPRSRPGVRGALMLRWVIPIVAAAVTAVLVIAGVQGLRTNVQPAPQPTRSDAPSPTPTSTPAPDATVDPRVAPPQLFDGDCATMLPLEQLAPELPGDVRFIDRNGDPSRDDPDASVIERTDFIVRANGGVTCSMLVDIDGGPTFYLVGSIVAFPDAAAPLAEQNECAEGFSESGYGPTFCGIEIVQNGIRFTGGVTATAEGATRADATRLANTVIGILRGTADAAPAPTVPAQPAGAWSLPVECEEVDRVGREQGGIPDDVDFFAEPGTDAGPPPGVFELLGNSPFASCFWSGIDVNDISLRPGGVWAEPQVASFPGSSPVTVPGFDRSYFVEQYHQGEPSGGGLLHLFRGVNWVVVTFRDDSPIEDSFAFVGAVADAADALVGNSAAPSNAPTVAPTSQATVDPDAPVLTTAGYGDVKIGRAVPASTKDVTWYQAVDNCGFWVAGDVNSTERVSVEVGGKKTGKVTRISVSDPAVRTKSGAHVGMTEQEIAALFPNATQPAGSGAYVVKDNLGQVVFYLNGDTKLVYAILVVPASDNVGELMGYGICG